MPKQQSQVPTVTYVKMHNRSQLYYVMGVGWKLEYL